MAATEAETPAERAAPDLAWNVRPLMAVLDDLPELQRIPKAVVALFAEFASCAKPTKIALLMAVRNEATVVARCLESAAAIVSSFLIHDYGSTDGTVAIIEEFAARQGIVGEVKRMRMPAQFTFHVERVLLSKDAHVCPLTREADFFLSLDPDDYLCTITEEIPSGAAVNGLFAAIRDNPKAGVFVFMKRVRESWMAAWALGKRDREEVGIVIQSIPGLEIRQQKSI